MLTAILILASIVSHALSLLLAAALGVNAKNDDAFGIAIAGVLSLALCLLGLLLLLIAGMRLGGAQ